MNQRLLFPHTVLIKRWATEQFLLATQQMYADHPVYTFQKEQTESKIIIMPTYGDSSDSGKRPKILSQTGGYGYSFKDTLDRNFAEDIYDPNTNETIGRRYVKTVRMTMMILVQAYTEQESSDMADELAALIALQGTHVYADHGLIVEDVVVGETNVLSEKDKTHQTSLNLVVESIIEVDDLQESENVTIDFGVEMPEFSTDHPSVRVHPKSDGRTFRY